MAPPVKSPFARGSRGFLLVEATLTAVVIGVGLVFISRSLAGNLKQLSTIQQYDRLLQLAESTLAEVEVQAQHAPPLTARAGEYESPNEAYAWTLEMNPLALQGLAPQSMTEVVLTVSRRDERPPVIRLHTVWPTVWLEAHSP